MYTNIHHEFPAIITCLETYINTIANADSRAREKDKAKELKGKILNVHFLLNLSGLAVYDEESVRVIILTKTILDLPNLSLKLHQDEVSKYL